MDLALIGNCSYQALIDSRARVRWLCWPRFDSSFVFGNLIDDAKGGEFSIAAADDEATTEQSYVGHTNVLRTVFRSRHGDFEVTDFAPRFIQFDRSFKPTMLVRRIRPLSGTPIVRIECNPVYDYGETVPGSYVASNHIEWLLEGSRLRLTTNAPTTYVQTGAPFHLETDLYLVLAWGEPLEAPLMDTCEAFLGRTLSYWERWVKHAAIPECYQDAVIRSALVLKLHQFEDTGAITAATTTSIPEHAGSGRTWDYRYCWLRDACFTLGALRRLGHFEEMEAFLRYLHNLAHRYADPQPVFGIGGECDLSESILEHLSGYKGEGPVRIGNDAYRQQQNDVYGEMMAALSPLYLDIRFAEQFSPKLVRAMLTRVEKNIDTKGAGLWEKRESPRVHAFSLLMHWAGARAAARVGEWKSDARLEQRAEAIQERVRAIIEDTCWREELGYYSESPEDDSADAAMLMMVNVGFLDKDHPRALSHVNSLGKTLAVNDHLLYRYVLDDGIGDTRAAFTVCGFWYAEALAHLCEQDRARAVFDKLLGYRNHVGLLSEDIDPTTGEQWGNFPQTYSHVGIINTAFALSRVTSPLL